MGLTGILLIVLGGFGLFYGLYICAKKQYKETMCPNCYSLDLIVSDLGCVFCKTCKHEFDVKDLV